MEIFKIRNKEGLYWKGHASNDFSKQGKSWNQINHATSAITNAKIGYNERTIPDYLKGCEIVKFELVEKKVIKIE